MIRGVAGVLLGCLVVAGGVLETRASDRDHVLRLGVVWIAPTGEWTTDGFFVEPVDPETRVEFSGDLTLEPDDAVGVAFSYEWRLTRRLGAEVGFFGAQHDISGRLTGVAQLIRNEDNEVLDEMTFDETETVGDITFTPWTVGVNVHLTPAKKIDVYAGPYLAYVLYGDLDIDGDKIPIDDEFTFGVVAGVDVPIGIGGWMFCGSLRYLHTQATASDTDRMVLDFDPYVAQAGAAYRF